MVPKLKQTTHHTAQEHDMSTSATYNIDGTTFYCHWDNYPAGAAERFIAMVDAMTQPGTDGSYRVTEDRRGGAAFAFIRGNLDAGPGQDTGVEFAYTLTTGPGNKITVTMLDVYANKSTTLPLDEFIRTHANPERVDDAQLVLSITKRDDYGPERTVYATRAVASRVAAAYAVRMQRFPETNPNHQISHKRMTEWAAAVHG